MSGTEAPELTIIQPGQGKEAFLGTIGVVFKLFGEQTNGLVSIVEHPFPVGACVPPHLHTKEDEYSIVTEGEIGFRSGDREVVLGPGGYITKPRGEVHTMWNAGRVPARMIEVISPAGFEDYFTELAAFFPADAPPDLDGMLDATGRYGLEMDFESLERLVRRFDLTPPPELAPETS